MVAIQGNVMDQDFETGKQRRSEVLGTEYVEQMLIDADDFSRPFQHAMTTWCWGFGWGDETIDPKTRSLMNLTMIAALGKMDEWKLHLKGALSNGVSVNEIRSVIHVIAIYCGVPQGVECFRAAREVLEAAGKLPSEAKDK